jgi:hypothetical protein
VDIDDGAWSDALDAWAVEAHRQGVQANLDGAKAVQKMARGLVTALWHAPNTRTPSPEGAPPASISGRLAASLQADQDGDDALVGPTSIASSDKGPYPRFLELGGTQHASNPSGSMWWFEDGRWHHAAELKKAPRSYLGRATRFLIASGFLLNIYYERWLLAQSVVTSP